MLGGAPANGKSAFIRSGIVEYPPDALKIDPDEIKMMLPEYRSLLNMQEPLAAWFVHEESSYLSKKLRQKAIAEGTDLVLDGVNNESIEKRIEDVKALKCNGHWVRVDYVTLDTDLSLWLAKIRFQRTGRLVSERVIKNAARSLAKLIPLLIELHLFDELYLWDTNIAAEPRLILRQKSGKLVIVDKMLYENFKRKADEEQKG
jgi:predicted ABC-type ATPase